MAASRLIARATAPCNSNWFYVHSSCLLGQPGFGKSVGIGPGVSYYCNGTYRLSEAVYHRPDERLIERLAACSPSSVPATSSPPTPLGDGLVEATGRPRSTTLASPADIRMGHQFTIRARRGALPHAALLPG